MQGAVVGQYSGEYHGARHGNGHAENGPGLPVPAEGQGHGRPQKRGDGDLDNRAGQGHRLYGQQILEVKVQTDSEHEQNDAYFCVL